MRLRLHGVACHVASSHRSSRGFVRRYRRRGRVANQLPIAALSEATASWIAFPASPLPAATSLTLAENWSNADLAAVMSPLCREVRIELDSVLRLVALSALSPPDVCPVVIAVSTRSSALSATWAPRL